MTKQELKRLIIKAIMLYDGCSEKEWESMWNRYIEGAKEGHNGDCTDKPRTCFKCLVDEIEEIVDKVVEGFGSSQA